MKTCLFTFFFVIFFAEQTSAQSFTLQDFASLYGLQGAWGLSTKRGGLLHEVWQIQNMQYLQSKSFMVRDKDTIPQESVQLRYQDGRITYTSTVPNQNAGQPVTFTLVSHAGGEYIFENKAHDFPQRIVYRVPADSTLDVYIEGPSSGSVKKIPYPFKRIAPAPLKPNMDYLNRKVRSLAEPSVFQKEIDGAFPQRTLYHDSLVTVLGSNNPQLPTHLLIVPNRRIPTLNDATEADEALLGHMLLTATKMAEQLGIAETGYRLAFNTNEDAGQSAFHLHLHVLGGARTGAMVDQSWRNIRRRLLDTVQLSPLEKRLLGTWSAKGQAFGMPADVTMKWEPDMQNKFLLLSYRMDMRDTAGRVQTFEGKAYYKASTEAGKFTATWFDSGGEVHPIEANYDGESLTALWGTPTTKMGKTVYRFVDDNTIEITDFIQRKDGEWRQFNRNTVRRM